MSRLRRLVLSDRFFFVTCRLLPEWIPAFAGMTAGGAEF
jgi:hypothetical protein